jgi:hypothetical protein
MSCSSNLLSRLSRSRSSGVSPSNFCVAIRSPRKCSKTVSILCELTADSTVVSFFFSPLQPNLDAKNIRSKLGRVGPDNFGSFRDVVNPASYLPHSFARRTGLPCRLLCGLESVLYLRNRWLVHKMLVALFFMEQIELIDRRRNANAPVDKTIDTSSGIHGSLRNTRCYPPWPQAAIHRRSQHRKAGRMSLRFSPKSFQYLARLSQFG